MVVVMMMMMIIIIISCIFRKWDGGGAWTGLIWLSIGTVGGLS
jgi:hypothetical protein